MKWLKAGTAVPERGLPAFSLGFTGQEGRMRVRAGPYAPVCKVEHQIRQRGFARLGCAGTGAGQLTLLLLLAQHLVDEAIGLCLFRAQPVIAVRVRGDGLQGLSGVEGKDFVQALLK